MHHLCLDVKLLNITTLRLMIQSVHFTNLRVVLVNVKLLCSDSSFSHALPEQAQPH